MNSAQGDLQPSMGSPARESPLVNNAALHSAFLRHPSIRHLQIVCSLLCTSKQMGAALAQHCKGAVLLTLPAKQPQLAQCISWLAKNGHLVSSVNMGSTNGQEAALAVVDALQQAAAAAGGLQLVSFTSSRAVPVAALQQLPNSLTSLSVALRMRKSALQDSMPLVVHAFARLTGLRSLKLSDARADIFTALAGLQQLTAFSFAGSADTQHLQAQLQRLPTQLKQLGLSITVRRRPHAFADRDVPVPGLLLAHLTQLTKLSVGGVQLTGSSKLPNSLWEVQLSSCASAAPLLPLQQLQKLVVTDRAMCAEQLQLSSMQQVQLVYRDMPLNSAATGWSAVAALSSLNIIWTEFQDIIISEAAVVQIGRCQGLTHLCMDGLLVGGPGIEVEATPLQLGAALGQLKQLRSLRLLSIVLLPLEDEDEAAAQRSMVACMQTIARLPKLSCLALEAWYYRVTGAAAAVELGAASNLTSLHLCDFDLDDYTFNTLALRLTQLQALSVERNHCAAAALSDGIVPVIARQLRQLTALYLAGSSLTQRGRQGLLALKPLQGLEMGEGESDCDSLPEWLTNLEEFHSFGWSSESSSESEVGA